MSQPLFRLSFIFIISGMITLQVWNKYRFMKILITGGAGYWF